MLLRLGMVVGRGGALERMLLPFKLGAGGPIGSGRQWWPWIAMEDVVGVVRFLLEHPAASGPLNLVAPQEVRCADFARTLGRVLNRPSVLPLPAAAARLMLGEMADALLLASARVRPAGLRGSATPSGSRPRHRHPACHRLRAAPAGIRARLGIDLGDQGVKPSIGAPWQVAGRPS
jgi:uncharacterized protein (TIGR01777 family)